MSQWKRKIRIADLGRVVTGKTPPTKEPELYGENYAFITPTDIGNDSRYVETARFISERGRERHSSAMLPTKAVCFTCIASIGKICMTNQMSLTNQQINSIIVDQEKHDPQYVFYLLRTETERIRALASGVATPIINKSAFSDIEIEVPPLPTQRKIAAILSAYDDLIENNLRRIKILEEMAQALYREWFVKFRFPGHEQARFVDSPLGRIPEGWEVKRLADVCDLTMGQSPRSEYYNAEGIGLPFHQGVTDFGDRYPTERLYCTVEGRVAEKGDILFSVRAPVGRINIATTKIVIGRGLSAIRHRAGFQWFAYHLLKESFREEDSMGGGTIFKSVTRSDMEGISFLSPELPPLQQYERLVEPMEIQIEDLTRKNSNLRRTRDLLLPKLVSGEVDVSELDIAVPEAVGA